MSHIPQFVLPERLDPISHAINLIVRSGINNTLIAQALTILIAGEEEEPKRQEKYVAFLVEEVFKDETIIPDGVALSRLVAGALVAFPDVASDFAKRIVETGSPSVPIGSVDGAQRRQFTFFYGCLLGILRGSAILSQTSVSVGTIDMFRKNLPRLLEFLLFKRETLDLHAPKEGPLAADLSQTIALFVDHLSGSVTADILSVIGEHEKELVAEREEKNTFLYLFLHEFTYKIFGSLNLGARTKLLNHGYLAACTWGSCM